MAWLLTGGVVVLASLAYDVGRSRGRAD